MRKNEEMLTDAQIQKMEDSGTVKFMFQSMQVQNAVVNKRQFILIILLILALIGTNAGWIIYESQYVDIISVKQDVDTQDAPAYVNGTGDMTINGEGETNNN